MELIVIFVIGVLTGCIITTIMIVSKSIGSIRIENSDPEEYSYLFLELAKEKDMRDIYKKKYVTMKVDLK